MGEVCAWICLFLKDARVQDLDESDLKPPTMSPALRQVFDETYNLASVLEVRAQPRARCGRLLLTVHPGSGGA